MKNVIVIGGSGMLGCVLIPYLEKAGYTVISAGRKLRDEKAGPFLILDYEDNNSIAKTLGVLDPLFIINLAALTNVDQCEKNPHDAYAANVLVVERISDWVNKAEKCHLIQISTDQVYDGRGPHSESNVKLINYYGFSKYAGELAALNCSSTVLRTNFFGKSLCPGRSSFSDWALEALHNNRKIRVFEDVYFSPLSMVSLCRYIEKIMEAPICGIFNLGSHDGLSKADFVYELAELFELSEKNISRASVLNAELIAPRPVDMRMNCSKFESSFGIKLPSLKHELKSLTLEYKKYVEAAAEY